MILFNIIIYSYPSSRIINWTRKLNEEFLIDEMGFLDKYDVYWQKKYVLNN